MSATRPARRRKACEQCRQQKIRCDGEPPQICSRCHRMGLRCVLSSNPNVRKTKAQLQREVELLRLQSEPTSSTATQQLFSGSDGSHVDPAVSISSYIVSPVESHGPSAASLDERCCARDFSGQEIDALKIRDCFELFFRDYAPSLPVFDANLSPNEYYDLCPFLFWAMLFVGSRRYSRDPTLLGRLRPRINAMALLALEARATPIETIKGLLLLCLWPIPLNTMFKDISHVLSGAAVALAMQIGLHLTGSGQDFSRTILNGGRARVVDRAHLWMHCLMYLISTNIQEGISPLFLTDPSAISLDDESLDAEFPPQIRLRRKMFSILTSSRAAIIRVLPSAENISHPNALRSIIAVADSQLFALAAQISDPKDVATLGCCRIHILAFYFLDHVTSQHEQGLVQLYTTACNFLEDATNQHLTTRLAELCTMFVERTVMLAALSVFKIYRSNLAPYIDVNAGEKAFFSAIRFCRQASLENDDLGARGVSILSQLWTSQNVFRRPNGQVDSLGTRIRTRLSMSVVFDCFWWWREEFAGQSSPYSEDARRMSATSHHNTSFEDMVDAQQAPRQRRRHSQGTQQRGLTRPTRMPQRP
ncbi:hypothetical protein GE09DRAFT_962033 [Coniochaeta sp. 2T2.1]|nr:hypothetical protein GE09DRAFT_962033 [Coniochaeta sp. 2T2.1]